MIFRIIAFIGIYTLLSPNGSLLAQKRADVSGYWFGKATVDYGNGKREEFEYELFLTQNGKKLTGYSVTVLVVDGKQYMAKAAIEGEVKNNYVTCRETHNVYEDKIPESSWEPFTRMEMIYRKLSGEQETLEGLYESGDKFDGRIMLRKKPPRA